MSDFNFFLPIGKVDKNKRTVSGYASTPTKDSDGEIVTLDAIKAALPGYMDYGNIREMHKTSAVGVAEEANVDEKGLYLTAKIVDEVAWQKCLEGVYKGFSIGGRKLDKIGNKITELEMTEISIVDRPANPDCRINVAKSEKNLGEAGGFLLKLKKKISPENKALVKMARIVEDLAKANPPAAHDGFSLPAKPNKKEETEIGVKDSRPNEEKTKKAEDASNVEMCEKHQRENCALCAVEKIQEQNKNSKKENKKAKKLAKQQARLIEEQNTNLNGTNFLILKKKKSTSAEELFPLKKSMNSVGSLSYTFDSLRSVQRSLLMEAQREGGDKKDADLAKRLGVLSKELADIISQKASHEGSEAIDLTDADDQYVSSLLAEGLNKMSESNTTNDPLADALNKFMKKAAAPSRAQRMMIARDNTDKSRKAMKKARAAIEEAHAMHKAAYLAKAAKKNDDEFDHAGAMEKLQKAYAELDAAKTFNKAVSAQLEKMHSGQVGQETTDPESGVYEVPPGVKNLSLNDLATASPGGKESGSTPPLYPSDGSVYPGKANTVGDLQKFAKNGMISAEVAQLLFEKAQVTGELEALRRIPATAMNNNRRPYAFDLNKVAGNSSGQNSEANKTLFDGVDVNALNSGDDSMRQREVAKVTGNYILSSQFGKSILSGDFHGAAGGKN